VIVVPSSFRELIAFVKPMLAIPLLLMGIAVAPSRAQQSKPLPVPVDASSPAARAQALIDEFIGVMPQDPTELRRAGVRQQLAPKALQVLQRIRAFAVEQPTTMLAERVHEFTVYAAVLDEPGLRESLSKRASDGDRDAELLSRVQAVITAADGAPRAAAIEACAGALRAKPEGAACELDERVASCAVQCIAVAAELNEAEARALAAAGAAEPLAKRLLGIADAAARHPRRLLDKPFDVRGELVDGSAFDSASLRGKVVLVDFWATWCAPCVRSLPELVALRREFGEQGLAVVGVSSDREPAALREFLARHADVDWPQLFSRDTRDWHPMAREAGIDSIPRIFLIDRKGVLRSVDAGKDLRATVRRLLAE
jgi:thiol-disulfide isomerase/thioredoxin